MKTDAKNAESPLLTGWAEVLVILFILFAFLVMAAGSFPMIALDRKAKSIDTQNIRQLGICLLAESSDREDKRFPASYNGTNAAQTSTEAFNYLVSTQALPEKRLVYARGSTKRVPDSNSLPDLTADNVGYNYMKATVNGVEGGVPVDADDRLPLLWSSGNEPLIIQDGACELKLKLTGIWKLSGSTVYYKGNSASFKKPTYANETNAGIRNFISAGFETKGVTYSELAP